MKHFFTRHSVCLRSNARRIPWNKSLWVVVLLFLSFHFEGFGQGATPANLNVINNPFTIDFNDLVAPGATANVAGKPYMVSGVSDSATIISNGVPHIFEGVYRYPSVGPNFSFGIRTNNTNQVAYYGVGFRNNTGQPIKCVKIRYKVLQWNKGHSGNVIERHPFSYLISGVAPTDLVGPGWIPQPELDGIGDKSNGVCITPSVVTIDGLDIANQVYREHTIILPTAIPSPAHLTLRWQVTTNIGLCFNPSLAIDDLEITPYSSAPPVSGVTVSDLGVDPCYGVSVQFTPPPNFNSNLISGYEIEVDTNNVLYRSLFSPPTLTNVFVDAVRSGNYTARVRTLSNAMCNNSTWETSANFFLPPPTPVAVSASPVTSCYNTQVTLEYFHPFVEGVVWEYKLGLCSDPGVFTPNNMIGQSVSFFSNMTKCYRALISYNNPYSCQRYSDPVQVTIEDLYGEIYPANEGGVEFCGPAVGELDLYGSSGDIVWEKQPRCFGNFLPTPLVNTPTYNFTGLTETTCFRAKITSINDPSCFIYTNSVRILISQNPVVASANALKNSICSGDTNRVSVNFYSGDIQWQKDPLCTGNWMDVTDMGPNNSGRQYYYNTGALNQNYCFRAVVESPGCPNPVISNPVTISVLPSLNIPTVAGNNQTCINGVDTFRVNNPQFGVHYNWTGWPPTARVISGQGTPNLILSFFGVSMGSFNLLVTATSGNCSVSSVNAFPVSIVPQTQPGNLTPEQSTLCAGSQNPVTLTVSGHVGNIIRWESSTNNFLTVTTITHTLPTLQVDNLTQTTRYRAIVKNGSCLDIPTRIVTIQVSGTVQGGNLTSNVETVCGNQNSVYLSLSGFSGQVVRWETSADNFINNVNTLNNTNPFLSVVNLTQTTYYRVVVSSLGCPQERSSVAVINFSLNTDAGSLSGTSNVCGGINTGTITLTGNTGDIIQWESSNNNFLTFNVIANTATTFTFNDLHQSTQFRALVRNGSCAARYTVPFSVSVSQQINPGQLIGATTLCSGNNSGSIQLVGNIGEVLRWESSLDGFVNINTIANTTRTLNYSNITENTAYRVIVHNPICGEVTSAPATITILVSGDNGTISATENIICRNSSTNISLSGNTSPVQKWQKSIGNCNGNWLDIFTNATTINTGFLNEATCFRAVVSHPNCTQLFSNTLLIEVNSIRKDSIRVSQISCRNANDGVIRLYYSGSANLEYSINSGQSYSSNNVFTNLSPGNYLVLARDAINNNCVASMELVNISQPLSSVDIIDAVIRNGDCREPENPAGSINITVLGGTPPYSFLWSNQATTEDLLNVSPGEYSVTVTDNNGQGCSKSATYSVGGPAFFTLSGTVTNAVCSGASNGAIVLTVVGGSLPITYLWNDNVTTPNRSNIVAGNYTVTVTDDLGCMQSKSFVVADGAQITLNFTSQNVPCQNSSTGSIIVSPTGGTAPYTYRWSNGHVSNSIFGLNAGTYTVTVSDNNGCSVIGSKNIIATSGPTPPTATPSSSEVCLGSAVLLSATTPDVGVQYQWFETQDAIFAFNVGSLIEVIPNSLGQKNYFVQAVFNNRPSCPSSRVPVSFTVIQGVDPGTVSGTSQICFGQVATLSISPVPQLVVRWESSTNNFINVTTINQQTPSISLSGLTQTTAFRAVVRNGACPETRTNPHTVFVSPSFSAGFISGATSVCSGSNSSTLLLSQNSPNTSVVRWESSTDNFNGNVVTINHTGLSLQVSNLLTTTSYRAVVQNGSCPFLTTQPATITVNNCGGIAVNEQSLAFGNNVLGCESLQKNYRVTGVNLTGDLLIEAPNGILIATDVIGPFLNSLTLSHSNGNVNANIYVKVSNNAPLGLLNGLIIHRSNGQNTVTINVSANVQVNGTPQFVATPSILTFGEVVVNTPSLPASYLLSATNLSGNNISIQVSAPYGLSLNPAGPFSGTLVIPIQGCSIESRVYVRFTPQVVGPVTELIVHTNNGQPFTLQASGFGIFDPQVQQADVVLAEDLTDQNEVDNMFGPGQFTLGVNAFSSLQMAVDRTGPNKTLFIAGNNVHGQNVIIENPISIIGQGQDLTRIVPTGNRTNNYGGANPSDALDPTYLSNHAFIVRSDNVRIRNLSIDGGSNSPCENRFGVGIITDSQTASEIRNLEIENVNIRHVYSRGIQVSGAGRSHDIRNVEIIDVCQRFNPNSIIAAEASGIYSDDPLSIQDVTIRDAGSGIILRNFGGLDEMTAIQRTIIENVIEDGIHVDMRSNPLGDLRIQGNTIQSVGDVGIEGIGLTGNAVIGGLTDELKNRININSLRSEENGTGIRISYSRGTLVQNNEINGQGRESGIELFQNVDVNNPIILRTNVLRRTGNFATNPSLDESVGVFMSDNGQYVNAANAPSYARMEGNSIDGFNIGVFTNGNSVEGNVFVEILPDINGVSNTIRNAKEGIRINGSSRARVMYNARSIENSEIGIYVYGGDVYMEGNAFRNNGTAVLVEDKLGILGTATIFNNTFTNNSKNVVNNSAVTTNSVNASWNWWGTTNSSDVRSKIFGKVDFSPYYVDGRDADNNLNNGWSGVADEIYVDAASQRTSPAGHIQEAVNDNRVMKVNVVSGIYDETLTVNRSIILTHNEAGFNPIMVNLVMANSGATLTMEKSFDLTGQLSLNGGRIVVGNDKILTILRGGNTSQGSASSYVIGNFARQSVSTTSNELYFPIGSSSAFRPATLSVSQATNSLNTYIGRVVEPNTLVRQTPQGIHSVSGTRIHRFSRSGGAGIANANIRLTFGNDDPFTSNQNKLTILKDNDGLGSVWTDIGGSVVNNTILSESGFVSLGNYVLALKSIDEGSNNNGGNNEGEGNNTIIASEIVNVNNITASSALVIWSVPTCIGSRYDFRYRVTGEQNWTTISNLTSNSYFMMGLQSGTRYEISVRSICPGQPFSNWSTTLLNNFTTLQSGSCDGATPPVPGGVLINSITARTARISWNLVTNGNGQGTIVNFGPINVSPNLWTQSIICHPENSFIFTNLQPNTIYGVRIRTNCSNCTTAFNSNDRRSNWSQVFAFSTSGTRELNDNISDASGLGIQNLNLYPNPSEGIFNVSFESDIEGEVNLHILDVKGATVFDRSFRVSEGKNELPIELNGFAEGIYNLMIIHAGKVNNTKLLIR